MGATPHLPPRCKHQGTGGENVDSEDTWILIQPLPHPITPNVRLTSWSLSFLISKMDQHSPLWSIAIGLEMYGKYLIQSLTKSWCQ